MEEEMKDFNRLLNIKPEESFELDARNYAFNTFKIINDNIDLLMSNSNFDNIIDKILGMKFNYRHGLKYSLADFILNSIDSVVDTGRGVPTEHEIERCEGGKFVIGLILQILKEKNRIEQAKSFVLSLVDEVNGRASRYREEISESKKNCDTRSVREYCGHYEGIKVSIMAILQALSDRNMVECEKLFIDKLDSTIKIEMKDVFSKPELPMYNNPGINDSSDANYLGTLGAMEICKLLEYAYINKYNFITQNLFSLLRGEILLNAIRSSGHFCYYACMIPSENYKTVKNNFTKWERFKIYVYCIVWLFVKPPKTNVKIKTDTSTKSESIVENAKQIIRKQDYSESKELNKLEKGKDSGRNAIEENK